MTRRLTFRTRLLWWWFGRGDLVLSAQWLHTLLRRSDS